VNFKSFSASGGFAPRLPTGAPPLDPAGGLCPPESLHCFLVFHIMASALVSLQHYKNTKTLEHNISKATQEF